ncbi:hypothetical protein M2273_004285 [Mucilaginibacter lappiensis]
MEFTLLLIKNQTTSLNIYLKVSNVLIMLQTIFLYIKGDHSTLRITQTI